MQQEPQVFPAVLSTAFFFLLIASFVVGAVFVLLRVVRKKPYEENRERG